jgi:hypothetical protein
LVDANLERIHTLSVSTTKLTESETTMTTTETTKTTKTAVKHCVIRIDTARYGWIVSRHLTVGSAQKHCIKLRETLNNRYANAIASLVYTTAECAGAVGERVRYA